MHDSGLSFRHERYPAYKATREKLTDELQSDFDTGMERICQLLEAYRIPILSLRGYEADDVIGTLARQSTEQRTNVVIVSGDKDFQQLVIVRRMVRDLNFKTIIIAVPTVREGDGLACSSRNQYLNPQERKQAGVLHKALLAAANAGNKSAREIVVIVRKVIGEAPLGRIDYVELVDAETLQPIATVRPNSLLAVAVFFGKTRLIDNIRLG